MTSCTSNDGREFFFTALLSAFVERFQIFETTLLTAQSLEKLL